MPFASFRNITVGISISKSDRRRSKAHPALNPSSTFGSLSANSREGTPAGLTLVVSNSLDPDTLIVGVGDGLEVFEQVKGAISVNLPATVPFHASQMYAKNVAAFLLHLSKEGKLVFDLEDQITRETLVAFRGEIVHPRVRSALGLPANAGIEKKGEFSWKD